MYIKLPKHIRATAVAVLVTALAKVIQDGLPDTMDSCELNPTRRAARLAAEAAVCVLLAHEIGQEVNSDLAGVPETPVGG